MTILHPPGTTVRVEAVRALILAPHYDDEVLGCGGLAAQLVAAGTAVQVLFLTDGAAMPPQGQPAEEYAARRRAEARSACQQLGVSELEELGLPDGQLELRVDELATAIEARLLAAAEQRPVDLLLVPSPLEITADHRAAFAAVHRLLAPLRGAGALAAAVRDLRVLAYEVNRLLFPDLLVDITGQLDQIEAAMRAYPSQQERHDYLAAKLALARYRTFSIPRGAAEAAADSPAAMAAVATTAVEAYRQLTPADFTTRSPAQLIAHMGGVAPLLQVSEGPKVSVVVRTKDRPDHLKQALASLAASTYRNVEVVLVNDGGEPPRPPSDFPLPLLRVELPEDLGRARAAQAGVEAATGDYVGFLDDDDVVAPEHLATLVELVASPGVRVAYTDAAVVVYELSAGARGESESLGGWCPVERRLPYSRDFDPDILLLDNYIPFHTLLIERGLFAEAGEFDASFDFFEDWEFLIRLARCTPFHHLRAVTCEYRHYRGGGHHILGETPRSRADFLKVKGRVLDKHRELLTPERLARAVDTLRREVVERGEQVHQAKRELLAQRAAHQEILEATRGQLEAAHRRAGEEESQRHQLHGEVVALRADTERMAQELASSAAEIGRLFGEETQLRHDLSAQTETVAATYAEIERLGGIIESMQSTRAWRFHQWLLRWRS